VSVPGIELFALEGGVVAQPYALGDATDWPVRLKTSERLTPELLAPFTRVPVRSVWLMGRGHTDRDIAIAAETFSELADIYAPFTPKLTDESIRSLAPLAANFRSFGVLRSGITDEGAKLLASFPELRVARLEHSRLTDVGVAALGSCRNMQHVHLDGNRGVTGSGLEAFVDHPSLRALFLSGTLVDDDAIGYLSGCVELRDVWLSSTRVSERCLLTLPRNPDLSVGLPRELDQERVDEIRRGLNFVVDGVGPDHVVDVPRIEDGAAVDLPPQLRSNALTFAVFTSQSCPPCKWLKTTFDTVRPNLREQFKFVELEIEENLELASALRVRSVPAVFVMQFGIELDRFVGAMGVERLTERLEAVLAL
jgi:thiol-disulfide isomerase/thioredoxin